MHSSFPRLIRTFSKPAWPLYFNLGMAVSVSGRIILPFLPLLALKLLKYLHQCREVLLWLWDLVLQGCEIPAPLPKFCIEKQQGAKTNAQLPKNQTPGGCASGINGVWWIFQS